MFGKYLLRIMVFFVRGRGAEKIEKKKKKTDRTKLLKMKRKKNEEYKKSQIRTINIFDFNFCVKVMFCLKV